MKRCVRSFHHRFLQTRPFALMVYILEQANQAVGRLDGLASLLTHGLDRLRSGFPLSLRLIREIHEILLSKGRGSGKQPGEFRQSQNWIGGSRPGNAAFVPPPPELVSIPAGAQKIGISAPTVAKSLDHMQRLGILRDHRTRTPPVIRVRGLSHNIE
jgi:hypothetical protein